MKGIDEYREILQKSKSDKERKDAIEELRELGKEAKGVLKELMKIVNGRDNFVIQGIAEEVVIKIGEPAIPELAKLLKSPIRKRRLKGLGLLGDIAANDEKTINKIISEIKPVALWDLNFNVRSNAVTALGKILQKNKTNKEAIKLLGEILRKERHPNVRHDVSNELEKGDKKLVLNEVMKSLDRKNYSFLRMSGDNRVAAANILYLLTYDNPNVIKEAIPTLLKLLEKDPYPPLRVTVVLPLILAGGWDIIEDVLLIVVKDRWYQVRTTALASAQLLVHKKASKKKIETVVSIIKKIEREDKYEIVQDRARNLLEDFKEIM